MGFNKKQMKSPTLKPLNETKWENRINAIRPLKQALKTLLPH